MSDSHPLPGRADWPRDEALAAARRAVRPGLLSASALRAEFREHDAGVRERGLNLEVELLLTRSQQLDAERARIDARAAELESQQSRLESGRQALKADERWVRGRMAAVVRRESAVTLCILLNALAATVLVIWKILG